MDEVKFQTPYMIGRLFAAIIGEGDDPEQLLFELFKYADNIVFPRMRKDGYPDLRYKPVNNGVYLDVKVSLPLADALREGKVRSDEIPLIPRYAASAELA